MNFLNSDFGEVYRNYTNCYLSYAEQKDFLLDYVTSKQTVFCKEDNMISSTVDIRLDIDSQRGFPEKNPALCLSVTRLSNKKLPTQRNCKEPNLILTAEYYSS